MKALGHRPGHRLDAAASVKGDLHILRGGDRGGRDDEHDMQHQDPAKEGDTRIASTACQRLELRLALLSALKKAHEEFHGRLQIRLVDHLVGRMHVTGGHG